MPPEDEIRVAPITIFHLFDEGGQSLCGEFVYRDWVDGSDSFEWNGIKRHQGERDCAKCWRLGLLQKRRTDAAKA